MNKETRIINGNQLENYNNYQRIVNGANLKKNNKVKYNFFCNIGSNDSYAPLAGAAYIGKNIVVTAAHVVYGIRSPSLINVRFGKKNLNHPGLKFNIKKILIHPNYNNKTTDNDIALLFLDQKPGRYGINKLYLPSKRLSNIIYKLDKKGIILGYGSNNFIIGRQPIFLQEAEIKILDKNKSLIPKSWITKNMITAGDYNDINNPFDNEDACQGDSGGPFFGPYGRNNELVLMGITSWGVGCGLNNFPGVYTKIGNYTQWIYQNWFYDYKL